MSGLAFINPKWGYMSQGPFCSLPLRPFWYRLALAWIPRYLIAVIILGLAIAIYAHVGFEFRALAHSFQADKPSISTTTPMLSVRSAETGSVSMPAMSEYQISQFRRGSSVVSMIGASRRASVVASVGSQVTDFVNDTTHALAAPEGSNTVDRCYMLPPLQSYNTTSPTHQPTPNKDTKDLPPPESHMQQHLAQQHLRIHRQLRLMFIYPLAYVLVWLFPFINHCFTYSDAFARHPVYWLNLISTICITLMGAIDCLIFSLRERPWRHIAFSDGTFLGSFQFWHHASAPTAGVSPRACAEANPETPVGVVEGWKGSVKRAGRSVARSSGNSDYVRDQADMARLRLEMEKEERRGTLGEESGEKARVGRMRRSTVMTGMTGLEVIESPGEEKGEGEVQDGAEEEKVVSGRGGDDELGAR